MFSKLLREERRSLRDDEMPEENATNAEEPRRLPVERVQSLPEQTENAERVERAIRRKAQPKKAVSSAQEPLLFEKYSMKDVKVSDQSLVSYINLRPTAYPNIFGRRKYDAYYRAHINIIERLINKLMRGGTGKKIGGRVIRTEGRLQGKKTKVMHILEEAFEKINKQTGKNPVQVLVDALQNAAPIEDTTRVRYIWMASRPVLRGKKMCVWPWDTSNTSRIFSATSSTATSQPPQLAAQYNASCGLLMRPPPALPVPLLEIAGAHWSPGATAPTPALLR
jgi:ribosomal protein uS7